MTTPVALVAGPARRLLPDAAFDVVLAATFTDAPKLMKLPPKRK